MKVQQQRERKMISKLKFTVSSLMIMFLLFAAYANAQGKADDNTGARISNVTSLNGLKGDVILEAGANIAITPLGNTLTISSTVADPSKNAYHEDFPLSFGIGSGLSEVDIPVPAGKRLVIEYLTVKGILPPDQGLHSFTILTALAGTNGLRAHAFHLNEIAGAGAMSERFYFNEQVRLYSDSLVRFRAIRTSNLGAGGFAVSISGHLVDIQ